MRGGTTAEAQLQGHSGTSAILLMEALWLPRPAPQEQAREQWLLTCGVTTPPHTPFIRYPIDQTFTLQFGSKIAVMK